MFEIPNANLPTNAQHLFANVPTINIPRSSFVRTHTHKTAFDADYLIPIWVDEALPGDTFDLDMAFQARLPAPLKTALMDNLYIDFFFFAVACRTVQTNFPKIFGSEVNPGDSNAIQTPIMTPPVGGYTDLSLEDYMGWPIGVPNVNLVSLWHRAYNKIWNENFRDQNLQNSVVVDLDDGPDASTDYVLLKRGKRHDYFTSALPWPQKSDSSVSLPLGSTAPVIVNSTDTSAAIIRVAATHAVAAGAGLQTEAVTGIFETTAGTNVILDPATSLVTNLAGATSATINQLREAFAQQQMYELDARSGTRFPEFLEAHFGVYIPMATMQFAEYLGGGSVPINITPIASTAETASWKQGNLTAVGSASGRIGFTKSFVEHTLLIGLANVRGDITYQNPSIHRMFSRRDRFDFYHPAMANLGEQGILVQEIFAVNGATDTDADGIPDNEEIWGYQEAWAEYRYSKSLITSVFRSDYATPLDSWHLAEDFASAPALNAAFIVSNTGTPLDRASAVPTQPHVIFDSFFRINTVRPMPVYSVPGLQRL